jgi:uncharacterized membrane protein YgcG
MGGSNTVTLSLSSDGGCCDVVETITLGVVNECHKADSGFSSFMQAVGDGMFHQDIQIEIFTDSSCTYGGRAADLSNRAICDTAGSTTFHSFRLSESGGSGDPSSPPSGGSSGGGGGGGGGSSSPDTHGCVVGHC